MSIEETADILECNAPVEAGSLNLVEVNVSLFGEPENGGRIASAGTPGLGWVSGLVGGDGTA